MPVPAGGVLVQINMIGEIHGEITQNAFHFLAKNTAEDFGDTLTECRALLTDFIGLVVLAIRTWACDDWAVKTCVLITMVPRHTIMLEERIANGTGFQGDDSLPSFCAGLLSLRTGRGGRSAHGRLYLAGVPESTSGDSRIQGSSITEFAAIGDILLARYGTGGTNHKWQYGIYSRKLGDDRDPGPPPHIEHHIGGFLNVIEIIPRLEVATMRKRKLHKGQ